MRRSRHRTPKWIERQIDEALLFLATQTGFLYLHRRARRAAPKVAVGAAVVTGLGAAAAATAAGIGAVGLAGGAVAWYRHRAKTPGAEVPALGADWHTTRAGTTPVTAVGSDSGESPAKDVQSGPSAKK